jgi:CRP-like cAMP-binding protein
LSHAAWLLTAIDSMGTNPAVYLLQSALREQLGRCSERIFYLLACVYDAQVILRARENLLYGAADKQAYALELLDTQLERELKGDCFALIEDLTPSQRLRRLSAYALLRELTRAQWLQELSSPSERVTEWVAECARYTIDAISGAFERADRGGKAMLSLIEKVIILKKVPIFTGTPDDVLADVARVLDEVEYSAGQKIIEKGDAGDSMYLIASGRVRAHDGDITLNILIEGQQFGETALLDPGPRTASVTALEDTRLLRLDQATLYELMEDRPEVSRGIIRVLSRFLRERLDDLSELRKQQSGVTIP